MKSLVNVAIAIVAGAACGGAYAAGSLEEWEMTTTSSGPMAMGPQKMIVCQKKTDGMHAPAQSQSQCKMTAMGKSGNKGTFTMECAGEHPTTIKGEGVQTADTMEGTMTIITSGMEIKSSYTGKRLGTCEKEGARNVAGSGMPAMPGMDMNSMMDPRNRPGRTDGGAGPDDGGATAQAGVKAPAAPPTQAGRDTRQDEPKKEEPKKEETKDVAGKAVDAAKKALNGLLSF